MSDVIVYGNPLDVMEEQPDSPRLEMTAEGVVMIYRHWKANPAAALAQQPRPKQLDILGFHAQCVQSSVEGNRGTIWDVRATYQGYLFLPFTVYEFANSRLDRPIQLHPKFTDGGVFPDATKVFVIPNPAQPLVKTFQKFQDADPVDANNKFRGIEAFIVGSAQWRKTSYSITPDFEQTDVGKINTPEAGPYQALIPDPANVDKSWLKIEKTCRNLLKGASILWEITEVWQFNDLGWLSEIYGP